MKATLEFNLPEERQEHEAAVHGMDWASSLWDVDIEVRKWVKYGNEFKTVDEALVAVRDLIRLTVEERGLSFEEVL